MKKENYADAEKRCEASFASTGNWYHLFTSGKTTRAFLQDDEDFRYAMNLLARCCKEYPKLIIVAFAIMDNHIHLVISGERDIIDRFFATLRRRLSRYLFTRHSFSLPDTFEATLKIIPDLKTLRNTIVYVNRNGYLVRPDCTPFSYPWGSGFCYFNVLPETNKLSSLTIKAQRVLLKGRLSPAMADAMLMSNDCVSPLSYCHIKFGMAMFRDAHHYFSLVSKGIESYAEVAADIDDGEYLTDQELFVELFKILRSDYSGMTVRDLSSAQKLDLARSLHFQFRSSNDQIRRLLNISQHDLDTLFPRH